MVKKLLLVLGLVVALCFATSGMVFAAPLNLENNEYVRTYASELVVGSGLKLYDNEALATAANGELDFEFQFTIPTTNIGNLGGSVLRLTGQLDPAGTAVWQGIAAGNPSFLVNGRTASSYNVFDNGNTGTFIIDFTCPTTLAVPAANRLVSMVVGLTPLSGVTLTSQTAVALKVGLTTRPGGVSLYANGSDAYLAFADAIATTIAANANPDQVDVAQQRLFFDGLAAGGDRNILLGTVDYGLNNLYNGPAGALQAPFTSNSNAVAVGTVLSQAGLTVSASSGSYDAFQNVTGGLSLQNSGWCVDANINARPATFLNSTTAQWTASTALRDYIDAGPRGICGTVAAANTVQIPTPTTNLATLNPVSNAGYNLSSATQSGALAPIESNGDAAMIMFANNPTAAPGFYPRVTNAGSQDCTVYVDVWSEDGTPAPNFSFDLYTVSGASTSTSFTSAGRLKANASFMFTAQALMDAAGITTASRMRVRVYGDTTWIDIQGYTTPGSGGELFIQSW
jgi:hypothetical protein